MDRRRARNTLRLMATRIRGIAVLAALLAISAASGAQAAPLAGPRWSPAASMTTARAFGTGTQPLQLPNGKVLVVDGAMPQAAPVASAELYDPATNTWTSAGSMDVPRIG